MPPSRKSSSSKPPSSKPPSPEPQAPACASLAQAAAESRTVRDLLRYGVSRMNEAKLFFGHGMIDARQECAFLLQWGLHLPVDDIETYLDARLALSERKAVLGLIEARCAQRLPAAYLTGEAWLGGLCFKSDRRALVPRSLIAEAMQNGLSDWLTASPKSLLDLCTGGGSLAILAALQWPATKVVASDLSRDALSLAAENVALHGLQSRIELIESDLLSALPARRFDLILCNPPYVNSDSMKALPPEYRAEPELALAGGADGMDLIRRICAQAPAYLSPKGALLLEIGHERANFECAFGRVEFGYVPVSQGDQMLVWLPRASLLRMGQPISTAGAATIRAVQGKSA